MKKLWMQIGIAVCIVFLSAVIGLGCGLSFERIGLYGEIGYQINPVEFNGNVFAIMAAVGCCLYFGHKDS